MNRLASTPRKKRSLFSKYWSHVFSFLLGCIFTSMSMTIMMHQDHLSSHPSAQHSHFEDKHMPKMDSSINLKKTDDASHNVAGLDCSAHGGPSNELAQEMVYWKNLPSDESYVSPFHDPDQRRYITFEPDGGGWNNIRMSMETVLVMAVATGRVLVLPPSQKMYREF